MTVNQNFGLEADAGTLAWIVRALEGELVSRPVTAHPERRMRAVTTDSRAVGRGDVFVALSGERHDGHDYVPGAVAAGALAVVVERETPLPGRPVGSDVEAVQLVVKSTRRAFGRIARAWRRARSLPLVAVGGSNGKTTSTQMVAAILREAFGAGAVHATAGNFNNDIGVPRTLLGLEAAHRAAVVEAGMNHRGEMAALADMIRPTVALLTNAQREHQAYLETVAETASENGLLIAALPDEGVAVFPADDACSDVWTSLSVARGVRATAYSFRKDVSADVRCALGDDGTLALSGALTLCARLSIAGVHNARNAAGAAIAAHAAGAPVEAIVRALEAFQALPGRGARERVEAPSGVFTLVDDAYNCNPDSATASLGMLAREKSPRIFLFGDMAELGPSSEAWHREVGEAARRFGVDRFWCAGSPTGALAAAEAFGPGARAFPDRDALIAALAELPLDGATVVVKSSHSAGFSRVVEALRAFGRTIAAG